MFGLTHEEERHFHESIAKGMIWVSIPTFLALHFAVPSPWGKTFRTMPLGINVGARVGWILFESPNLIWSAICCWHHNPSTFQPPNQFLLSLFALHYVNRGVIYPLRLGSARKPIPIEIVISATLYTCFNGYLQAQSLCQFQQFPSSEEYFLSLTFLVGFTIFLLGVAVNVHSDQILRSLTLSRRREEKHKAKNGEDNDGKSNDGYQIPYGGGFRYVSAPHYLGELIEWLGYALMMPNDNICAWAFFIYSASNLVPRAVVHHRWYLSRFPTEYPKLNRKAVVPFLW